MSVKRTNYPRATRVVATDAVEPDLVVDIFAANGGRVLVDVSRETTRGATNLASVWLTPEAESALLDLLTERANRKRDTALAEMHGRRYYRQGPAVRRDLTRS